MIARIRHAAEPPGGVRRLLQTGIGDDAAVLRLPPGNALLVTTDFSLEGIHFRREWHPPESAGHRCLARGLSDIAAMGGEPRAAFLSLALPSRLPQGWVDRFLRGFLELGRQFGVVLAGGDVAQSLAGVLADVMVVGSAPAGRAILRSGARPRDAIYVTGALGGSAAAIRQLRAGTQLLPAGHPVHFFPTPRVAAGRFLRQKRLPTAMIDVSDGLSTDLAHICEESGVGAEIESRRIPIAKGSTLELALHGGEDYELLFTARRSARLPAAIGGVPIARIGEITRARSMWLVGANGRRIRLKAAGWEHFRA